MPKTIVICCDGTNNEIKADLSNVLKLYRITQKNERQIVFYDPGIGTLSSSNAWSRFLNLIRLVFCQMTGLGLDRNILTAYRFLMENYEDEDEIFMFGFSRGAYTVRALAGFIHLVGLLRKSQKNLCEYALVAYKTAAEKGDFEIAWQFKRITHTREIPIKFLGVWDTVSSVIEPRLSRLYIPQLVQLPYTKLNPLVEIFRQARAIDERRRMFRLNRWDDPQFYHPNPFDEDSKKSQNIKQVWFCGDHSDVGGGYPEDQSGLAKFPLSWMINEAVDKGLLINTSMMNHLVLGEPRKGATRNYVKPSVTAQLHNSMNIGWLLLEWIPKAVSRREWPKRLGLAWFYLPLAEPRLIADDDLVHYSVYDRMKAMPDYRPANLMAAKAQIEN